jgi:hypothetical protein
VSRCSASLQVPHLASLFSSRELSHEMHRRVILESAGRAEALRPIAQDATRVARADIGENARLVLSVCTTAFESFVIRIGARAARIPNRCGQH